MKIYLPVEVLTKQNTEFWYLDVTKLGINDLISLRKELINSNDYTIAKLDGIIYDEIGYRYESLTYKDKRERKENVKRKARRKFSKGARR